MDSIPGKVRSELCETPAEEVASSVTHGIGVLLSVVALVYMLIFSVGDVYKVVAASVFGASLIALYLSSTLYHSFSRPRLKAFFQCLDHSCIYLLIAGSYTPVTLINLRGAWGWSLLSVVWGLALSGVIIKMVIKGKKDSWVSTAIYIIMGWLVVVAAGPLIRSMEPGGIALLVAGGLCYTLGVGFFLWEKLKFNHAIWHLFVLAGSACHVLAMLFYTFR